MKTNQLEAPLQINIMTKAKAFVSLMKLRLSSLVVLSAFFGFFMKNPKNALNTTSEDKRNFIRETNAFALVIILICNGASNWFVFIWWRN